MKAKMIVEAVLADLTDRRGIKQAWGEIDDDIKNEILIDLENIVQEILNKGEQ